ncbi:MAG: extracellular solute-binding protein, partial [Ruminococcus callidus]
INASVMSGDLPDVITVDGPNISAYAANGIIQPLAELSEEEKSAYLDSILDQGTVDDKLYALGAMESSVGLYYNKAILEKAGIEVPDKDHPWTFSKFLDILEQLKPIMDSKNGYPLDMTFPVGESSIYYYAPFIWSNGGDLISEDGLTADGYFNSDKNAEAFQYFRGLVENSICPQHPLKTCLKADVQRSSLTVHGKSTRSIRATVTSTLALHRILSVTTGTAADIRRLVPGLCCHYKNGTH